MLPQREKNNPYDLVQSKNLHLRDVNVLLSKHYDDSWKFLQTLTNYKNVLEKWFNPEISENHDHEPKQHQSCCEMQEECSDLII